MTNLKIQNQLISLVSQKFQYPKKILINSQIKNNSKNIRVQALKVITEISKMMILQMQN